MRSKKMIAAIGLIGVLMIAAPVLSQDGSYEPIIAKAPTVTDPTITSEPTVELLPSVELIAPTEPYDFISARWSLDTRDAFTSVLPTTVYQPIASQITPAQSIHNAFEKIQTPQADMILGPEVLDPVISAEGKCDTKKKKPRKTWSGNVELGLDGTEGNTQTFNFHIGASTKRKTTRSIFSTDLDYNKSHTDSIDTANRLFSESRLERLHHSTPWTWYAHNSVDYDEFQPWNVQISCDTGIGYQLIESDSTDLTSRFGGGGSQETGGPDNVFVPELLFGLEFEHRHGDRHKFKVAIEYFPDVTDFTEFRMVDKASWEILLDKVLNLSLSLNVTDTINRPNPGGKESDLDYSVLLLWNF